MHKFKLFNFYYFKVVSVWNFLNIKRSGLDIRLNDPNRAVVSFANDVRLLNLQTFAEGVSNMSGGKGYGRNKSLTSETRNALFSTLNGIVLLIKQLLSQNHSYVLPGIFQTDRLEGEFGVYRFAIFCFILVKDLMEKS